MIIITSKEELFIETRENIFVCSDLSNNQISVIAADAFDGLRSLTSL